MIYWHIVLLHLFRRLVAYPFVYVNFIDAYALTLRLSRRQHCNLTLRTGATFRVRGGPEDIGILDEVFIGNYYNRTAFEIQPNDIVLDIGAYIGDFTVFAAKKALNGKVFSFEPIKELYQLARFNTAQNNCANVQLFPFGLSSRTGVEQFKVDASKPLADTSAYSLSSNAKTIKGLVINGTSFLQACDSIKPTYVKIDCEGAEFDILYNLKRKYFKSVRVMIVEYHEIFADAKKTGAELKKYLEKLDFEVTDTGGLVFSTIGLLYCKNRKPL